MPQLMPGPVIMPWVGIGEIVSAYKIRLKVTATVSAWVIWTVHLVPLTLWQPDQTPSWRSEARRAGRATLVPLATDWKQSPGQLVPQLMTEPLLLALDAAGEKATGVKITQTVH